MKKILKKRIGAFLLAVCMVFGTFSVPALAEEQAPENSEKSAVEIPFITKEPYDDTLAAGMNFGMVSGEDVIIQPITVKTAGQFYLVSEFENLQTEEDTNACIVSLHSSAACDQTDQLQEWRSKSGVISGIQYLPAGNYYLKAEFSKKKKDSYTLMFQAMMVSSAIPKNQLLKNNYEYYFYNESGKAASVQVKLPKDGQIYLFSAYDDTKKDEYQNVDVTVYNAAGKKICAKHTLDSELGECYALKAGTYTIKIQGQRGLYSVYTQYKAFKDGKNHSKSSAKKILPGQDYESLLALNGSKSGDVWYKFKLDNDSKNKLTLYNYSGSENIHYAVYRGNSIIDSGSLPAIKENSSFAQEMGDMSTSQTVNGDKTWKKGTYYVRFYKTSSRTSAAVGIYQTAYMSLMQVKSVKNQIYNGSMKMPAFQIYNGSQKLIEDKNYILTYTNNQKIGTASVKIEGLGKYKGSITKTFKILPGQVTVTKTKPGKKSFTVKWKKTSGISGYEVRYASNKHMQHAKTLKVTGKNQISAKIRNLKSKKNYYVQVRAYKKTGSTIYRGSWSSQKKVKVK